MGARDIYCLVTDSKLKGSLVDYIVFFTSLSLYCDIENSLNKERERDLLREQQRAYLARFWYGQDFKCF